MNRTLLSSMVLGAALLSSGAAFAAAPSIPTSTPSTHVKRVHFELRNDTDQTITLKAGRQELSIDPGKTKSVRLPVGMNLVTEDATPTNAAGTVLVQVAAMLGDATVVLK